MTGLQTTMRTGRAYPLAISGLLYLNSYKTAVAVAPLTFTSAGPASRSITFSTPHHRVDLATGWHGGVTNLFYNGTSCAQSGYSAPGNNATLTVSEVGTTYVGCVNASGSPETVGVGVGAAAVTLGGYCPSYTDLLRGYVMTTGGTAYAINRALVSASAPVLASGTYANRTLGVNAPALAMGFSGEFTFFTYYRPETISTDAAWASAQAGNAGTGSVAQPRHSSATAHSLLLRDASNAATTISATLSPGLTLNTWQLLAVTYSAGTARWFIDGVQVGTASGADRVRTAMDLVYIGSRASYPSGAGALLCARAVDGGASRAMTAAELVALTTWCRSEYV